MGAWSVRIKGYAPSDSSRRYGESFLHHLTPLPSLLSPFLPSSYSCSSSGSSLPPAPPLERERLILPSSPSYSRFQGHHYPSLLEKEKKIFIILIIVHFKAYSSNKENDTFFYSIQYFYWRCSWRVFIKVSIYICVSPWAYQSWGKQLLPPVRSYHGASGDKLIGRG